MRPTLGLAVVLAVFWLVLSGHYTSMLLALGAASIGLVVWLAYRMDIVDPEAHALELGRRAPGFWIWLGGQIMLSSWDVTRRIWTGQPEVRPAMGKVPASGMSPVAQVTYANSITLTPGTLSVSVEDDGIDVHGLDKGLIEDLRKGAMERRARRIEAS